MFCKACGKKIDDDSQYCSYCGTKLTIPSSLVEEKPTEASILHTTTSPPTIQFQPKPKYDETYEKDSLAMMAGIILLLISLAIAITQPFEFKSYESAQQANLFLMVGSLLVRILAVLYCLNLAKGQNRDTFGWGVFGFILPSIALIILGNTNKFYNEEEQKKKTQTLKPFRKDDAYKHLPTYQNYPLLTVDGLIEELTKVKPFLVGVPATSFIAAIASIITWKPNTTPIPVFIDKVQQNKLRQTLTNKMNFARLNDFYLKNDKSIETIKKFENEMIEFLGLV